MKKTFKILSLFSRIGRKRRPTEDMPRLEVETMDDATATLNTVSDDPAIAHDLADTIAGSPMETSSEKIALATEAGENNTVEPTDNEILDAVSVEIEVSEIEALPSPEETAGPTTHGEALENEDTAAPEVLKTAPVESTPVVQAYRTGGEKRHRFGEYVYRKGLISKDALHAASLEQEVTNRKIGQILVANGFLSDKDRVEAILATEHSRIAQEKVSRCRIPVEVLAEYNIMISAEQDDRIYVASAEDDRLVKMVVKDYYPEKEVEMVSYDASSMNLFLAAMRKMSSIDDPANAEELMLDRIVYNALTDGASDIHIEPRALAYSILYRKDGVRRLIHTGALAEYQVLMAENRVSGCIGP